MEVKEYQNTPIPCTWNGVNYPSIKKAAKALGISKATMSYRVSKGYTKDIDLYTTKPSVFWEGISYKSLSDASRTLGIKRRLLRYYLDKGFSSFKDVKNNAKQGSVYIVTAKEYGELYKIGYTTDIEKRLKHFQTATPYNIYLVHRIKSNDIQYVERRIHDMLKKYEYSGEWFQLPKRILNRIMAIQEIKR